MSSLGRNKIEDLAVMRVIGRPTALLPHSDLPELARDLFAPALEREKLLRFWIETS